MALLLHGDQTARSHLRVQAIGVPVTQLERSVAFFEQALGFATVQRVTGPTGVRLAFIAPPDGVAVLMLSETDEGAPVGTTTGILFVTDDIARQYDQWLARGVRFRHAPKAVGLGARQTTFFDPDSNAFELIEADAVTNMIEAERRRAADLAERERLAEHEIRIATQVQAGLLPRQRPPMQTLEYSGMCVQARQVGGDYFDFLDLGGGRLGVVIGDVSGKGIGAALLMATLQAHIRSQYSLHASDLPALLASVNRQFQDSTPASSYASLFIGVYHDGTRALTYVNCGHPPALVIRRSRQAEWLDATGSILGMFEDWSGTARTIHLASGDTFVLYTDGITEAVDQDGNEFGTTAMRALCEHGGDADALLHTVVNAVREFSGDRQYDDLTIVAGRVRARP